MRLYEITSENNLWLVTTKNDQLKVIESYLTISTIFDRLLQGFNYPNNTNYWYAAFDEFEIAYKAGLDYLDSFPDQSDSFIGIHNAQIKSYYIRVNQMTTKLKQLGKIS
jgi:hypothetical protein